MKANQQIPLLYFFFIHPAKILFPPVVYLDPFDKLWVTNTMGSTMTYYKVTICFVLFPR